MNQIRVTHLVAGTVFVAASLLWLLHHLDVVDLPALRWLGPLALIGCGGLGLLASWVNSRSVSRTTHDDVA